MPTRPKTDFPEGEPAPPPLPPVGRKSGCWWILLASTLAMLLIIYAGYRCTKSLVRQSSESVESLFEMDEETTYLASVVSQVRGLARLETASMEIIQILRVKQSHSVIPDLVAGDEVRLMAVGEVIAGIDLSEIREEDVRVEDGVLVIRLPRTRVLVTRLDNQKTEVLDRETGVLRKGDIHLESRARGEAEIAIRNEALRKGIREIARQNAEKQLAEFLMKLGAESVRFESELGPPSDGELR